MKSITFLFLFFWMVNGWSQIVNFETEMDESVEETSGLLFINDKIITHNDSGGDATLYEVDPDSGDITRRIFINNATNVDWEDLSMDENYIYIGDFGNNNGSRIDLKVYPIPLADFLSTNTVTAEIINFSYSDQVDFSPNNETNFDAETLLNFHDQLYIFTKNRGDFHSNIYPLPKEPGTYQITKTGEINPQILITGGTYDAQADAILLTGYSLQGSFIVTINEFMDNQINTGISNKYPITLVNSFQVEGIAPIGQYHYYLSTEGNSAVEPTLYQMNAYDILPIELVEKTPLLLFPNPASHIIRIESKGYSSATIYNISGQLLLSSQEKSIDISTLKSGLYFIHIKNKNGQITIQKIEVID